MCGLFGKFVKHGVIVTADRRLFTNLAFVSMTRGVDAIGVASLDNSLDDKNNSFVNFTKAAINPGEFFKHKEFTKVISKTNTKGLFGHVRSATRGEAGDSANAHPFLSSNGRFCVFHNGTLNNSHPHFGTDSEWLTERIAEKDGNLEEALKDVYGAYALVVIDVLKATVTFIRNSERTLYIGEQIAGDMVYASEDWMLTGPCKIPSHKVELLPVLEAREFKLNRQHATYVLSEERRYKVNPTVPFRQNYRFHQSALFDSDDSFFDFGTPYGEGVNENRPIDNSEKNEESGLHRFLSRTTDKPNYGFKVVSGGSEENEKNLGGSFVDLDGRAYTFTEGSTVWDLGPRTDGSTRYKFADLRNRLSLEDASILMLISECWLIENDEEIDDDGEFIPYDVVLVQTSTEEWVTLDVFKELVGQGSVKSKTVVPYSGTRKWIDKESYVLISEVN